MISQQYIYNATIVNVVDGDTVDVQIDLGFQMMSTQRLRLADIDCPEVHGPTREAGLAAKEFTRVTLLNKDVLIQTRKSDHFGRYLAKVWLNETCFNELIIQQGYAIPYRVDESGV